MHMSDRLTINKIETGYLVSTDDYRYDNKRYAFSTWEDTVEFIRNNPVVPVIVRNEGTEVAAALD